MGLVTGLNAFAFGFGLNDEALTFKWAADVGEVGTSIRGVTEVDPELFPLAGVAFAEARGLLPLKAGMGCMNMLIDPFPPFALSTGGFIEAGAFAGAGMGLVVPDGAAGTLRPSGAALAVAGCATTGRVALGVGFRTELTPIVRAWVELASLEALSRICFCFSSSLAKIGTKSSGMGLLSYGLRTYI